MNFRFTKQLLSILAIVFLSISLFVTFTQEVFQSSVSANLLVFKTPEIPVYIFIIGAFLVGLFIGLFVAVVDHFHMAKKMQELIDENRSITTTVPVTKEMKKDNESVDDSNDSEQDEEAPEA